MYWKSTSLAWKDISFNSLRIKKAAFKLKFDLYIFYKIQIMLTTCKLIIYPL